jgi:hypothetical protein
MRNSAGHFAGATANTFTRFRDDETVHPLLQPLALRPEICINHANIKVVNFQYIDIMRIRSTAVIDKNDDDS